MRLIDETSGERVHNYEFETTVNADVELLRNRLYAGFNLLYEPEVTWTATGETVREATLGGSAALSLRLMSNVVFGGEIWYLRHYDSPTLDGFHRRRRDAGTDALYPVHAENVHDRGLEHPGLGPRDRQSRLAQSGGVPAPSRQTEIRLGILMFLNTGKDDGCLLCR